MRILNSHWQGWLLWWTEQRPSPSPRPSCGQLRRDVTIKCGRLPTNENTFKHISASALSWALQGELLFSGDSLPNRGESHSQQDVPGGVTGTLSESEKRSRSRFSQCREHVCCSVTRPLGLVPGSLLGSFQKWGYLAARYLWLNPTYAGGSPSKTQKGSQVGLQGSPSLSGFLPSALPSLMPPHRLRCTP